MMEAANCDAPIIEIQSSNSCGDVGLSSTKSTAAPVINDAEIRRREKRNNSRKAHRVKETQKNGQWNRYPHSGRHATNCNKPDLFLPLSLSLSFFLFFSFSLSFFLSFFLSACFSPVPSLDFLSIIVVSVNESNLLSPPAESCLPSIDQLRPLIASTPGSNRGRYSKFVSQVESI